MDSYRYNPLRPDEIRLLRILPGEVFDDLKCELLHVSLDAIQTYEALSYTWGDNSKSEQLTIGDYQLGITANLHQALVHLKHKDLARLIWADAVCINQNDVAERNAQVRKMAEIYSFASDVIIWLGKEEDDVEPAFDIIPQIYDYMKEHGDKYMPNHHLNAGIKGPSAPEISSGDVVAISMLIQRPWFTRIWVLQEAILAKNAVIRSGSLSMPFNMFLKVFDYWYTKNFRPVIRIPLSRPLYGMMQINSLFQSTGLTLLQLLVLTRGCKSSDPRDRAFGIMSLLRSPSDIGFQIDYNLSCHETYTQLARHEIVHHKDLRFLSMAGLAISSGTLEIPSWVPDWSMCDNIYMALGYGAGSHFSAGGSTVANMESQGNNELELPSIFIDNIKDTGTKMLPSGVELGLDRPMKRGRDWLEDTSTETDVEDLFHDLEGLTKGLSSYPTGEDLDEVKQRTTVLDFLGEDTENDNAHWVVEYQSIYISCQKDPTLSIIPIIYSPSTGSTRSDSFNDVVQFDTRKERYLRTIADYTRCRVLCITKKGYIGWVPDITRRGDFIFVFPGAKVPFVLRPSENGSFKLIGECYLHGWMYGEAIKQDIKKEVVTLM
ncbi:hypothetical protein NM208_g13259 [Fusarium decemcellulare]|uniref:Uncharacterized protein n=1 Tax=Fusarium decemcellulare TaxID=57161 RepID=A0ACC1RN15_9HYPO|nr:hypothetical protein NM208_g13259 [Fusarium decemcellulare]